MSTEQNKALVRRFGDLINAHDADAAFALCSADFVDHGLPLGSPPGVENSRQFFKGRFAAFPDLQAIVLDMFVEGDKVVSRMELEGTHEGAADGDSPDREACEVEPHQHPPDCGRQDRRALDRDGYHESHAAAWRDSAASSGIGALEWPPGYRTCRFDAPALMYSLMGVSWD